MGKADNFSEWYNDIVEKADLIDKRYPIKGMDVWRPYGLAIMKAMDRFTHAEMERTGHQEVQFPLLIPQTEFNKEADQIKGFGSEVYWVTKGGDNDLDVPLVVRPTSETAMYPMFSLWVRSHNDLPLKVYQVVSVFRYETKQTRSFMRVREIHFFEAHTAHADYDDAERQIREDIEIWRNIADELCLPFVLSKRPDWDKFPGAFYSVAADALLPELKTLQVGTFHHYKTNFAEAYDITYEGEDGEHHHAHQTTYGMSERLLGAVVSVHGDDNGLMLPPAVAPIQAVIVPILFKGKEEPVLEACRALLDELKAQGVRAHLDDRDETAGFKYNDWEMRGVPVRIELGPRDLEKGHVVLVRRDNREKTFAPRDDLATQLRATLAEYAEGLKARARALLDENVHDVADLDEARDAKGILRVGWCGEEACGVQIEEKSDKTVLGRSVEAAFPAFDLQGDTLLRVEEDWGGAPCAACGKPDSPPVRLARTY